MPAIRPLLATRPRVIGFGEYHQKKGGPKVASSLKRFTARVLPLLRGLATDLVVETWVTEGRCGKAEKKVVAQVEKTTKRPQRTENEVIKLIKRARGLGIRPHILTLSCADYADLVGGGELDYVKLLTLTGKQLRQKVEAILDSALPNGSGGRSRQRVIAVYGGAVHNDVAPRRGLGAFSYGPAVSRRVEGRYLEIDLYVPEYIARDTSILKEEGWFPRFAERPLRRRALRITKGPRAYIVVFPATKTSRKHRLSTPPRER